MKHKWVAITTAIIVAAAAAVLAVYFVFFYAHDPADDLKTALDAVAAQNKVVADKYIDYDSFYGSGDDISLYANLMKDFSYTIDSLDKDGSTAEASISVSNRDMDHIYGDFVIDACQQVLYNEARDENEKLSSSEMENEVRGIFDEHIANDSSVTRTRVIKAQMRRSGHSWKIFIDEKYYDDIFGGYYSAQEKAQKLLESLDNGSAKELEAEYGSILDESALNVHRAVHFAVDDIWNDTLRNIVSFINSGTDADGNDYDIDEGLDKLETLTEQKEEYDDIINGLDDEKYSKVKKTWKKMGKSLNSLVRKVKTYDSDSEKDGAEKIDTGKLEKYLNTLVELTY